MADKEYDPTFLKKQTNYGPVHQDITMEISCPHCNTKYRIDVSRVPPGGKSVKCKKCGRRLNIPAVAGEGKIAAKDSERTIVQMDPAPARTSKQAKEPTKSSRILSVSDVDRKKVVFTAIIVFLLMTLQFKPVRSILYENWFFTTFDRRAEMHIDDSIKRALITFAAARGLNAVISVIQGSGVSIEPVGVGVSISLGEVLDPLNDLVERFSWVMLASLMALGIQKLFIQIGPWLSLKFMFSIALLFFLAALWLQGNYRLTCTRIAQKTLIVAFILRFAVPLATYVNTLVYDAILDEHYETASSQLQAESRAIKDSGLEDPMDELSSRQENNGLWGKAKSIINGAASAAKMKEKIAALKEKAGKLAQDFILLSVVFLLNTVLLPIAFLWGILKFSQLLLGTGFGLQVEQKFGEKVSAG